MYITGTGDRHQILYIEADEMSAKQAMQQNIKFDKHPREN